MKRYDNDDGVMVPYIMGKWVRESEASAKIAELEKERQWIPVSEKLPDMNMEVLVFDPDEVSELENGIDIDYYGYHFRDENDNKYDSFRSPTTTHWMPLPEPPAKES